VLVLILILLLLAAVFGILGAVLKAALIIALAIVLAVAMLTAAGYYYARYRWRRFSRELQTGRGRTVIDVPNEAGGDPRKLPDRRDPGVV
jgi:uncharacterized protein (DUF58 family)